MTITQKKKRSQSGFTLIEIAIIIAVVAILGAVGATRFANMTEDAKQTAAHNALANMRSALAIAIAKSASTNTVVDTAVLQNYVDPPGSIKNPAATKFDWEVNGTTTYTVNISKDTAGNIVSITSVTIGTITAQ